MVLCTNITVKVKEEASTGPGNTVTEEKKCLDTCCHRTVL